MPTDLKIDYVELPARDLDGVRAFYGAVFNWTFEAYGDAYLAFNDGRLDGGFYQSDAHSDSDTGAALIVFYAEHLEAVLAAITKAGGTIVKPVFDFPGGRRFHFADPSGNELAVWTDKPAPV